MNEAMAVETIMADSAADAGSARPDPAALIGFRAGWYDCISRWGDTLFEATDALLCAAAPVRSLPYLSLEPGCGRGWGSVYAALARGRLNVQTAQDLLAGHLPTGWPPVFAVDTSTWPRPHATTSPRRGMHPVADCANTTVRVLPGWSYQWVCQVSTQHDSWTAVADVTRIDPDQSANEIAATQMQAVTARLAAQRPGTVAWFCLDAGYCPITATLTVATHSPTPARVIVRIRRDRVFHFDPPPKPPGSPGRPQLHGDRFACADPGTWPAPTHQLSTTDEHYGPVTVQAWSGLHPRPAARRRWAPGHTTGKAAPIVRGTVIHLTVHHPKPGTAQHLWLWTAGPDPLTPDLLDRIWRAYLRRFAIEHMFRFLKQHLHWTMPAIRTPAQADLWTWLTAAAHTQLRLAAPLITDQRLPWEKPLTPNTLTPARVRRGFRSLAPHLPPQTKPRKPHRPGPGRPKGSRNTQPTTRHKVIIKGRKRTRR